MAAAKKPELDRNRRILVVDDNRAIHEDFYKILSGGQRHSELDVLHAELFGSDGVRVDESFELDSAFQGEEALERVRSARREDRPYAIAFVDIRMPPGLDGIETTASLLKEDPELGVVICSAYSDYSWEDITEAFGNTDRVLILKKPFDPVEVRQLAHALRKRWELARALATRVEDLEAIVAERTRELAESNEKLRCEAEAREEAMRKLAESNERIKALAYQDGLTGLPNRRLLDEHLEKVLARARRKGTQFAVLFIDFDNFKLINDTVGHQAADGVLKQLAESLSDLIRLEDMLSYGDTEVDIDTTISLEPITDSVLSRLGGDEFVVLLPETRDRFAAGIVANRILKHLERPIPTEKGDLVVTASIGIATYPHDGQTGDELIRNADTAMYHAKQQGKAGYQYYAEEMNAASVERLEIENRLRRALEQDGLELHYQPRVELATGRLVGAEALLRWRDDALGDVEPAKFIPVAEDSGLIFPLGEWVLQRACRQAADWRREGLGPVTVAVNVSAVQIGRHEFPDLVARALERSRLEPGLLELELTEAAVAFLRERAEVVLGQLRALGVRLSLDNFGTGYSSLGQLKRFSLSSIKVDRRFVAGFGNDPDAASVAEAAIAVGRILDLAVIAEGVESAAQAEVLTRLGCHFAQGDYFGTAAPPAGIAARLRA